MKELFTVNNKTIYDIDTTILTTSSFNYTEDAVYFINHKCCVITKDRTNNYNVSDNLLNLFNELELKNKKNLTKYDELKLKILSSLNENNQYYIFFNVLTYLDDTFKETLIKYLKDNNKRIINYTNEIEETLLLDYLIVIQENKIIMEGKKELVLQEEKILKKLGFNIPNIVELSKGLQYYGLVNKVYFNNKELVKDLWK